MQLGMIGLGRMGANLVRRLLRDGQPFVHAHVVLSDEQGNGKGGHLLPGGTPVFACELTIEEYDGAAIVRSRDERTGLSLWPDDSTL